MKEEIMHAIKGMKKKKGDGISMENIKTAGNFAIDKIIQMGNLIYV